jgi:uncharacterized protein YuzE
MTSTALSSLLPELAEELRLALLAAGESELAEQVEGLVVRSCTYDSSCEAGYIYVEPPASLNIVEQNIIGVRHGRTISVQHSCDVYLDTDNFDRVTGIELLSAAKYSLQLSSFSNA